MKYIRHAVNGCFKGNATGLEHLLSYENEWVIGDVCLSGGCWICKESDMCSVQDIEVVIDWFRVAMWGDTKMSKLPVGAVIECSCLPQSVDQGMRRARTFCYK